MASKQAQAQSVLEQIHLLDSQVEKAVERYNWANVQLSRIDGELKTNTRHLALSKAGLKTGQSRLAKRLVSIYVNGDNGSALEVLLGAESLDDLLNRLDAIDRVSKQDTRVITQVRRYKAEVVKRERTLTKARAAQERIVAQRADERRSIEGQLASRQRLLSSIQDQIQELKAAEARRQEQLRREAAARLVAQQRTASLQAEALAQRPSVLGTDGIGIDAVETTTAAPPSRYGGVVGIAMQYLGIPYVWAGASPAGFDCSGFTMYVFSQVGVALPHNAAAQFGAGVPVSRDQLEAGDLVFFDGLGHVGIYIGGGQFIHSPHTGDVVKISSIYDSWYASTWVGGRRIL